MTTPPPKRAPSDYPLEEGMPCYDAKDLLAGEQQVQIDLDGQLYTLRLTRNGKLILTK